ncbi:peptidase, M56 family [Lysobacter enzymogenes]|uniref:Peptidase, M56 family n=1 Tax=Lysobacter enzymogenes TaxID=69 RepID=A0A0S2DJK6_LYSEN|nr:M56 family metallopeptidase [Lysobacter enzymogenes]ALN58716.1 peptidase, M56 family [Lysobacter enzymogenes]
MTLYWIGEVLLPRLFAAGVQSLLMVAAIWLLVRWLRPSAAVRCWLWWCAALQLLVGALWPAPLELPLLPADWQRTAEAAAAPAAAQLSPAAQMPYLLTRADLAAAPAQIAAPADALQWLSWPALFAALWLAGVIVLVAASARAYLAVRRRVAGADECEHGPALRAYRALGASLGLRRLPPLRVSAQIDSPQLVGPPATVLLPQRQLAELSDDELAMALHHELAHLRRRDLWWGWVPALARHLFFFHPLAHVIAREYAIAREQACDAAVLDSRRYAAHDYGRLLLRLGVAPRPATGVAGASPTYTVLKRRLTMLQNKTLAARAPAERRLAARLGGAALIAAVAAFGLVPYKVTAAAEAAAAATVGAVAASAASPAVAAAGVAPAAVAASAAPVAAAASGAAPAPAPAPARTTSRSQSSKVVIRDGKTLQNERRITEINNGDMRTWAIKDGQYFRVRDDGRYEPVRDAATRARLDGMQRDAAQAEVEAAKATREAERAMRDAAVAAREAERAGREAQEEGRRARAEGERARIEAERAGREAQEQGRRARAQADRARAEAEQAGRQAQEEGRRARAEGERARREAELNHAQALRDAEQARRDAEQAKREAGLVREQAQRDRAQALRDGERARLEAGQRQRDGEQAQRDAAQARSNAEQARRDAAQRARDARQRALDSAQQQRDIEQALRDAQQSHRDAAQAQRDGRIGAADRARLQAYADMARRAVETIDVQALSREAAAAAHAVGPALRDSETLRRESLRAAEQAIRQVRRELADAGA